MQQFTGFRKQKVSIVPVPEPFFTELLPLVDDLVELKVTLFCMWLLSRKVDGPRLLTRAELEDHDLLAQALGSEEESPREALWAGLERAVSRGTLLRLMGRQGEREVDCYAVNSEKGRRLAEDLASGAVALPIEGAQGMTWTVERPNIFALYEQNIGLLTPLLADELRDAEESYPPEWIEEAFRLAIRRNARNWSYIRAILERWGREGKDGGDRTER